tara:strand:- start:445 stop:612 length:168 start_codon:yes stop_codon:yes gene_type:complete
MEEFIEPIEEELGEDIYNDLGLEEARMEDEISSEEEAFMRGYSDALEDTELEEEI